MGSNNRILRMAVVGLAHGAGHVGVIRRRDDMTLAAVCDLDIRRCAEVLQRCGVHDAPCFSSFKTMLERVELDGVVIATPLPLHAPMAVAALDRGLHVLLEKPLSVTLGEAEQIRAAAARSKGICQIGFEMRSSPLMQKIKEILHSGQLGQVLLLWATMFRGGTDSPWRIDPKICRGVFFDCFVHEINEFLSWADADFERAVAFGAPKGVKGACATAIPDTVTGTIEFQNAVRASFCFSQISRTTNDTHFGIVGTEGRIDGDPWLPEQAGSLWLYTHGGLYKTQIIIDGQKASRGHLGFAEQYDFFVRGVRAGKALICDVDDALRTQRLMAALDRSLAEGRVVGRGEFE